MGNIMMRSKENPVLMGSKGTKLFYALPSIRGSCIAFLKNIIVGTAARGERIWNSYYVS